jgi:alkane 1-monooxygenase
VPQADHLGTAEKVALFFGVGVISGTIGITYAHELMHQKNRWNAGWAICCWHGLYYSHFRSEHLRVHHLHVGTPRDPVTARYNEGSTAISPACC